MITRRTWIDLGVAAGSGLLMALALPVVLPIFSRQEILAGGCLEPLALFALVPLLIRVRRASPRRAFALGTLAGACFYLLALYWLDVAMTTFGNMPRALSVPVLFLLTGFLSLFWGTSLWAAVRVRTRTGIDLHWLLPPALVALEFLRNYILTGFPWANLGYTQVRTLWLSQLAALGGVYLVAFVVVFSNCVIESLWAWWKRTARLPRQAVIAWAAILGLSSIYSAVRLAGAPAPDDAPRLKVAVVQGNLDEKARLRGSMAQRFVFNRMLAESRQAAEEGARLIVWPEGTLPMAVRPETKSFEKTAKHAYAVAPLNVEIITGGITRGYQEGEPVLTNSAFFLDDQLNVKARYDKRHLVPFGEYVPLASILPYKWFIPEGIAFFTPGQSHDPVEIQAGRLGMLICYESIFPEIARESVDKGAQLLVNITNDSWYGFSSAPYQHLAISRMRAIETGRFLVRAANTGVSAVIDPLGREITRIPVGLSPTGKKRINVSELVPPDHRVRTVALLKGNTLYCLLGDWFAWICVLTIVGMLGWTLWKKGDRVKKS